MDKRNLLWKVNRTEQIADCRIFSVHRHFATPPGKAEDHDFYTLRPYNWVNVIPITEDGDVILIRQYRHGLHAVTLEVPGGMVDSHETESILAADRELLEETGYVAEKTIFLGRNHPNPAIQGNYCDSFLAKNVRKIQEPQFDTTEDIDLEIVPYKKIPSLIASGEISHALVIVAFYYLEMYEKSLV